MPESKKKPQNETKKVEEKVKEQIDVLQDMTDFLTGKTFDNLMKNVFDDNSTKDIDETAVTKDEEKDNGRRSESPISINVNLDGIFKRGSKRAATASPDEKGKGPPAGKSESTEE